MRRRVGRHFQAVHSLNECVAAGETSASRAVGQALRTLDTEYVWSSLQPGPRERERSMIPEESWCTVLLSSCSMALLVQFLEACLISLQE